jgi:GNAT superfamily N-acetyltransferase
MLKFKPVQSLGNYTQADITAGDVLELQAMMEVCQDYHQMAEGQPTYSYAARDVFETLPAGKTIEDKFVIGAWNAAREMVGVLEGVRGYPEPGIWWIGLLLLTPETRNDALGHKMLEAFRERAAQLGAHPSCSAYLKKTNPAYVFGNVKASPCCANPNRRNLGKDARGVGAGKKALTNSLRNVYLHFIACSSMAGMITGDLKRILPAFQLPPQPGEPFLLRTILLVIIKQLPQRLFGGKPTNSAKIQDDLFPRQDDSPE